MVTTSLRVLSAAVLATGLLTLSACGGSDDAPATSGDTNSTGSTGSSDKKPCEITSAATIQKVVGGTVAEGTPGTARNCEYVVQGGSVGTVEVYAFGPASGFDVLKSGYKANRGPLEELSGIGTSAFSPGDFGQNEIVVEAGGQVFAVGINAMTKKVNPKVKELAIAIAGELG